MNKISKRTALLLVAVLALGTLSVGTAMAKRSSGGTKPTLSLRASASYKLEDDLRQRHLQATSPRSARAQGVGRSRCS